ncbi:hypothetical protein E4H12_00580 [Candidatus Thorarchaeota archaeon]|nr:MAG: hypothetical protein E4H12_00580 [Candidatus Thorarchaeota archaeon]
MTPLTISRHRGMIIAVFIVIGIFAWSPWLTDSYAISAVTENLGGPDQEYNYIGEMIPVSDIPKNVVRVPFGLLVYFPRGLCTLSPSGDGYYRVF